MRMAAAAIVGVLSVGWGLDAAASGSAIQTAHQTAAYQVTVLKVEGMT
jgi:hypothetical protein